MVHSNDAASVAFGYFVRGVACVCVGNALWGVTEEACRVERGWRWFPGVMLYHVLSFYGYAMLSLYAVFVRHDSQSELCYFESCRTITAYSDSIA